MLTLHIYDRSFHNLLTCDKHRDIFQISDDNFKKHLHLNACYLLIDCYKTPACI